MVIPSITLMKKLRILFSFGVLSFFISANNFSFSQQEYESKTFTVNSGTLNLLIIMGLGALIVGIVPYVVTIHNEDVRLQKLGEQLVRSKR